MQNKKRILFIGEGASLAHLGRPFVLAQSLDPNHYEVHFACDEKYAHFFQDIHIRYWPIKSITGEDFIQNLKKNKPIFSYDILKEQVQEELQLFKKIKPQIVVGDFRLSLTVSARLEKLFYINITNAHYQFFTSKNSPMPESPILRLLGPRLARLLFNRVKSIIIPLTLKRLAAPLNKLRAHYNLSPIGDLFQTYTDGDLTLFSDTKKFVPIKNLHNNQYFIGPILWSPNIPLPHWWNNLDPNLPTVYLTPGSTGNAILINDLLKNLAKMKINIMVATAGQDFSKLKSYSNVYCEKYLPGIEAAKKSDLVICNGGSATSYQALACGVPVIGITSNTDQIYTMTLIEKSGSGKLFRDWSLLKSDFFETVLNILSSNNFSNKAKKVASDFHTYDTKKIFNKILENL